MSKIDTTDQELFAVSLQNAFFEVRTKVDYLIGIYNSTIENTTTKKIIYDRLTEARKKIEAIGFLADRPDQGGMK